MKVVILAGGLGTRISEETHLRPKPMIEIGGKPILWHIMKIYSHYGYNDFIICCGYKGYIIKEYFVNYLIHNSDLSVNLENNKLEIHDKKSESWNVTLVDTGELSGTGGRLKKISKYLENEENFCFTYGDGLSNININNLIDFHYEHGKLATVSAVQPPGRYGSLIIKNNYVNSFEEKPKGDGGRINGGFFVLSNKVLDLIDNFETNWESTPMKELARSNQLIPYIHDGFWQSMDTLRDKVLLEDLWSTGSSPWKVW